MSEKRADNREQSALILKQNDIKFISSNKGAHLIVQGFIDFWPGTGKWITRKGTTGFGVKNLIKFVKKETSNGRGVEL